jgi:hypothetical protein
MDHRHSAGVARSQRGRLTHAPTARVPSSPIVSAVNTAWRGEHGQAPAHLETAGGAERRRDPAPVYAAQGRRALQAAERLVALGRQVVTRGAAWPS